MRGAKSEQRAVPVRRPAMHATPGRSKTTAARTRKRIGSRRCPHESPIVKKGDRGAFLLSLLVTIFLFLIQAIIPAWRSPKVDESGAWTLGSLVSIWTKKKAGCLSLSPHIPPPPLLSSTCYCSGAIPALGFLGNTCS